MHDCKLKFSPREIRRKYGDTILSNSDFKGNS